MYNKTVMEHFRNPRNVGVIEGADGVGEVGNPLSTGHPCGGVRDARVRAAGSGSAQRALAADLPA